MLEPLFSRLSFTDITRETSNRSRLMDKWSAIDRRRDERRYGSEKVLAVTLKPLHAATIMFGLASSLYASDYPDKL